MPRRPAERLPRLTQPLVRRRRRAAPRQLGRSARRRRRRVSPRRRCPRPRRVRHVLLLEGHQRGQLPRPEVRPRRSSAPTTSTAATALDTLLASSVWRQSSEPAAARRRIRTPRPPTSSSCGARTRAKRTRSSSTTCWRRVERGARIFVVDPRRTATAELGRALARPPRRHRHRARARRRPRDHPRRARQHDLHRTGHAGFDEYTASVEEWTLERAEAVTGVAADDIVSLAHAYATRRPRPAVLDARHHRAPQRRRQRRLAHQPGAAHRPRRPARSGLSPCAARTTSRAAATWARVPNRLPGFQDILDDEARTEFDARVGQRRFRRARHST